MTARTWRIAALLFALGVSGAAQEPGADPAAAGERTQEPERVPEVFSGEVEQVTVDVVVVDGDGNPISDLTKEDFTVLDEGQPQEILSFDVVHSQTLQDLPEDWAPSRPRVVSNLDDDGERGRLFVILFDDLHMSPANAHRAKQSIAEFLETGTAPGDRVTLIATGGEAWWSTTLPQGKDDLIEILRHLDGRKLLDSALERITDYEALRVFLYRDPLTARRMLERLERYGTQFRSDQEDYYRRREGEEFYMRGAIDPYLEHRASEQYFRFTQRMNVSLDVIERTLRAVEGDRDRKSVLLVSEGFVHDPTNKMFKRVIETARRSNATLYFIDTTGLKGMGSVFDVEFGYSVPEQDLMAAIADVSQEGEGAVKLAHDTGGFSVRNTNDLVPGLERIGRESDTYYLLGYTPTDIPRDGRFRELDVRVARSGVKVRARRGYYAPGGDFRGELSARDRDPVLQKALDSLGNVDAIPLRMTSYVQEQTSMGKARVLLAGEIDLGEVAFPEGTDGRAVAALDTLVVVARRETGEFYRADQTVTLESKAGTTKPAGRAWYSFGRDFDLPAGGYQAKLVVRDTTTQRVGSLLYEFEIPPLDTLRVSTPLLSDQLQRGPDGQSAMPALEVAREIAAGATLYCRFDVFGAARNPDDGMPQVIAEHELRQVGGLSLGTSEPRYILPTSLGGLARLIQIPLSGAPAGEYELVLRVRDEITGESREVVEPFTITPRPRASATSSGS